MYGIISCMSMSLLSSTASLIGFFVNQISRLLLFYSESDDTSCVFSFLLVPNGTKSLGPHCSAGSQMTWTLRVNGPPAARGLVWRIMESLSCLRICTFRVAGLWKVCNSLSNIFVWSPFKTAAEAKTPALAQIISVFVQPAQKSISVTCCLC